MKLYIVWVYIIIAFSCSRSVTRLDANSPDIDLSGRWNDSDSRLVAEQMINEFKTSNSFKKYTDELGHKPTILVGPVVNRTSEHIDANTFLRSFEVAIFNSGSADLVESGVFRDKLRQERVDQQDFANPSTIAKWGNETGADIILFGEMTSQTDTGGSKRVVKYSTTLFLTEMETNKRVWYGQNEIRKFIRR